MQMILMEFVVRNTAKAAREQGINWGSEALLDLDDGDDLSILGENVWKMNEFLEVLRVQGACIGLQLIFTRLTRQDY